MEIAENSVIIIVVFSQFLVTLLIKIPADLIVELSHRLSFYRVVVTIDFDLPILLPWFVYQHHVFLTDGHIEMSDKAQSYEIFLLSLNPFYAIM
jgi:hypothetical protein